MGNLLASQCFRDSRHKAPFIGCFYVSCFFSLLSVNLQADESPWENTLSIDYLKGNYSGDTTKEDVDGVGISLKMDYLGQYQVSLGYQKVTIDYDELSLPINSVTQLSQKDNRFDGSMVFYSDMLNGKFTPGIQYQSIEGDLSSAELGDMTTKGAYLRYLNNSQSFYLDGHYSQSNYDEGIDVNQQDFAIGFSMFNASTWLQARFYIIESDSFVDNYQATDFIVKFWYKSHDHFVPESIYFSAMSGSRMLAVNPDTQSVWNLNEEHIENASFGADWVTLYRIKFSLVVAHNKYQLLTNEDTYTNSIAYIKLAKRW